MRLNAHVRNVQQRSVLDRSLQYAIEDEAIEYLQCEIWIQMLHRRIFDGSIVFHCLFSASLFIFIYH